MSDDDNDEAAKDDAKGRDKPIDDSDSDSEKETDKNKPFAELIKALRWKNCCSKSSLFILLLHNR